MLEELMKALGPWPILQTFLGLAVLSTGIVVIIKGINKGKDNDDKRADWAAYEQLKHIEENSFKSVALQERLVEIMGQLRDITWNRKQL